ncbi:hypothetical protein OR1_03103 [Geobacter sp. OR-1]|uniref:hypothetical protein n=1 Tax=Geobacter sp. OR-1 TaxID=1266765 RepID=UPI0005429E81|nr:hypothetical protein [Geobacter sp. OR-1]GAM10806.1 hypothetical protein OR1_03103 [Geobacter sp. OR-1]
MKKLMPSAIFVTAFAMHLIYLLVFREPGCGPPPTLSGYFSNGDVFLGFSYALGAAFSVWSFILFMSCRSKSSAAGAASGTVLTTGLAAAGCFLTGCCGSPMFAVYAGIFGIGTFTIPKWVVALLTASLCGASIWWQKKSRIGCGC